MMDMYGAKTSMVGGKKKKAAAKTGMHRMPDGKMMKNSSMKKMGKKK